MRSRFQSLSIDGPRSVWLCKTVVRIAVAAVAAVPWAPFIEPNANARTTQPIDGPSTALAYTWQAGAKGDWQSPASWTPMREQPAKTDMLLFNTGGSITVSNVASETVGQLSVVQGTSVNLQSVTAINLQISGGDGPDLVVGATSTLNLNGANPIEVGLLIGATGVINGAMTFSSTGAASHRLTAIDGGAIIFNDGAEFTAGQGFVGNPFGGTNLSSVVFDSGASYVCIAGGNPFGAPET